MLPAIHLQQDSLQGHVSTGGQSQDEADLLRCDEPGHTAAWHASAQGRTPPMWETRVTDPVAATVDIHACYNDSSLVNAMMQSMRTCTIISCFECIFVAFGLANMLHMAAVIGAGRSLGTHFHDQLQFRPELICCPCSPVTQPAYTRPHALIGCAQQLEDVKQLLPF